MTKKSVEKERKLQIFEAFHQCLLTKSFNEVSTREIAKIAGINHGMLYYFFKDKQDILLQYIDYVFEIYSTRFNDWLNNKINKKISDKNIANDIHEFITANVTLNREIAKIFIELWSIGNNNEAVKEKLKNIYAQWEDISFVYFTSNGFDDRNARTIGSIIIAFCEGIAIYLVLLERNEQDIKDMLDGFRDQIINVMKNIKKDKKQ